MKITQSNQYECEHIVAFANNGTEREYVRLDETATGNYHGGHAFGCANRRTLTRDHGEITDFPHDLFDSTYTQERYAYILNDVAAMPDVFGIYYGCGGAVLYMATDCADYADTRAALADYPVLDDEDLARVEEEIYQECKDDFLSDYANEIKEVDPDNEQLSDFLDYDCEADTLENCFMRSCEASGDYGHVECDQFTMDQGALGRVVQYGYEWIIREMKGVNKVLPLNL